MRRGEWLLVFIGMGFIVSIWLTVGFIVRTHDGQLVALPTLAALPTARAVVPTANPTVADQPDNARIVPENSAAAPLETNYTAALTMAPLQLNPPVAPVADQVMIRFAPEMTEPQRLAYIGSIHGVMGERINALNTIIVALPPGSDSDNLPAVPGVLGIEPDYVAVAAGLNVSEPFLADQWALAAIGAPDVWATLPDDLPGLTIAVIDSGICATHIELQRHLLTGWDFVEGDAVPQDDLGHGCGVAGVIAADIYNNIGMAGIAPNAQLMPLRVLDAQGMGTYSDLAAAIVHATNTGADIINVSMGGTQPSSILHDAVDYAAAQGVTVVAAAGNTGDETLFFPAGYESVIAVGAVDRDLQPSAFSSSGPTIDLYAPGLDILTIDPDGDYRLMSGTSLAAAHVTGLAALALGQGRELVLTGDLVAAGIVADASDSLANDDYYDAYFVDSLPYLDILDTREATTAADDPLPGCQTDPSVHASVWYAFTALDNGPVIFSTAGSSYDTVLSIWTGERGALVEVACNDDAALDLTAALDLLPVPGATYLVMVSGADVTALGDLVFLVEPLGQRVVDSTVIEAAENLDQSLFSTTAPALIMPANGITTADGRLGFAWRKLAGASQYEIYLDTSNPPGTMVASSDLIWYKPAESLALGTYFWRVRGLDDSGQVSAWSETSQIQIQSQTAAETSSADNAPLSDLQLLLPPDGFETNSSNLIFTWQPLEAAQTYRIQIANDPTFGNVAVDETQPSQIHVAIGLGAGTHYWRVRAIGSNGDSTGWSNSRTFTIQQRQSVLPNAGPRLILPGDNAIVATGAPSLQWESILNATQYDVQLDTVNPPGRMAGRVDTTTYTPSVLLSPGIYYWRVRGADAAGNTTNWSAVFSFTRPGTLDAPLLLNPASGHSLTSGQPTFNWQAIVGASHYEMQLDTVNPPITMVAAGNSLTYTPESALGWGTYYWRVRALDDIGTVSDWSATFTLALVAPTPTPTPTETIAPTSTSEPTAESTAESTQEATAEATAEPTTEVTAEVTEEVVSTDTATPTDEPTATHTPTDEPTATHTPTDEPTATHTPTDEPTATHTPTDEPVVETTVEVEST